MAVSNKYVNGKIYKVVDNNYTKMYIGSTIEALSTRMAKHRYDYRTSRGCYSKLIFEEFGIENCKIELIEVFPCNTKEELNSKEGEYIRNNICVNKCIPNRTIKELYILNREHRLVYQKQYRILNKQHILEYQKAYKLKKKTKEETQVISQE